MSGDTDLKRGQARNFDALNEVVAGSKYDRHLRFFNFGYQPLDGEEPVGPTLGPAFPNRESAQLLFQTVGEADLSGRRVAEIGCGRGGNLWLAHRYLGAGQVVGVDIAGRSVRFGAELVPPPAGSFVQGDAERVPLVDGSVDAVLSVETSCTYPDLAAFLTEVARVVRPGGWFCYTDLLPRAILPALLRGLDLLGFDVTEHRDITPNVRASRDLRAARQQLAFGDVDGPDNQAFDEFVATGGSTLHRYLDGTDRIYHLTRGRRRDVAPGTGAIFDRDEQAVIRDCARETVELLALTAGDG